MKHIMIGYGAINFHISSHIRFLKELPFNRESVKSVFFLYRANFLLRPLRGLDFLSTVNPGLHSRLRYAATKGVVPPRAKVLRPVPGLFKQ